MATSYQMLRKASVATLFGDKETVLEAVMASKSKPVFMFSIKGNAVGVREGEKAMGDGKVSHWKSLIGSFVCASGKTGEIFMTGQAFLPAYIANMIAGQLGEAGNSCEVDADVYAVYDKSAATSYVYEATLHSARADEEIVKALADRTASAMKALPKPTAD